MLNLCEGPDEGHITDRTHYRQDTLPTGHITDRIEKRRKVLRLAGFEPTASLSQLCYYHCLILFISACSWCGQPLPDRLQHPDGRDGLPLQLVQD